NELQYCYTTSWGVSTRMVGGIVMAHGDDKGLRLPPRLAPIQVVIVPIWRSDDQKDAVMEAIDSVQRELVDAGVRVHIDSREGLTPGFKFNDWEMRGVPVRMEIGPRDVQSGTAVLARRDILGKEGKKSVSQDGIASTINELLVEIQSNMLAQATEFRDAHLHRAKTYDELKDIVADGWALIPHCGSAECEARIKEETKASSRCFPLEENKDFDPNGAVCPVCGKPAVGLAYFARAY
ncbi:proline--tRNA ligase, partial [Candidatus Bipolaricaulota bacterium]|nr:proline--tRNA ligase [Candidatus Bipolaricaulota bacterium]